MIEDIRAFIAKDLLSGSTVADDQDLLLSGMIDSLGVMRLVAYLESHFGVTIPPEDVTIDHFETVNAIAAYLKGRAAA